MPVDSIHKSHSQTAVTVQHSDSGAVTEEAGRYTGRRCVATTTAATTAAPAPPCTSVFDVQDEELTIDTGTVRNTVSDDAGDAVTAIAATTTTTTVEESHQQPVLQRPCTVSVLSDLICSCSGNGICSPAEKEESCLRNGFHNQLQQRHQQRLQRAEQPHHDQLQHQQQTPELPHNHHHHHHQQQQLHYALGVPVEYGRARLDSLTGHDQLELRVEQLATRHQGQQLQLTQQEVDELLDHTARCCDHHERLQNVRQARDFMLQLQHIFDQHGLLGRNCQQQQQQSESGEPDPTTPEETERVPTRARRGSGGGISPRRPHQQAQPREVPAVTSVLQRLPIQAHFQPPIQQIGGSEAVDVYDDNNPVTTYPTKHYPLPPAFQAGCQEHWTWSQTDKSHEARLCGPRNITAFFHPNWSNGTAGVRGNRPLNGGVHFWEVRVASRVFGTSMMVGVGTRRVRLHVDAFVNMLGEDSAGWGLSHKGLLWHGGRNRPYTAPFKENVATVIGVLFDGLQGTLTFYKDGQCLGPAFTDLDKVEEDLFPVVCSTAAKTEMTLGARRRAYLSLQDRSRASILTSLPTDKKLACSAVLTLPLPNPLRQYLLEQVNSNAL